MAPRCQACGRAFADLDYLTGKPTTKCVCGRKRPAETQEDHGYTTRIGLAMANEPEAIPSQLQEEYSALAYEAKEEKLEELRQRSAEVIGGLAAVARSHELTAKDARTKRRLRAARRQLEDASRSIDRPDPMLESGLGPSHARQRGAGAEGLGTAAP